MGDCPAAARFFDYFVASVGIFVVWLRLRIVDTGGSGFKSELRGNS